MSGQPGPIFIGGLSGSGKTQLRIVLGAHPDISLTRRTYLWNRFHGRFGDLRDRGNLAKCLAALAADAHVQHLRPDWDRVRRELPAGEQSYARLFALLHEHHAEKSGKRRWGEQLRFVECFADSIFASFPSAQMIHMIRDPRVTDATDRSARSKPGKLGWDVAMWLHSADAARRNLRRFPGKYRVVRYETLAAQTAETIEDLCDFVGVEFLPAMSTELATVRFRDTDHRAVGAAASFVDLYAGDALTDLGYARTTSTAPYERERLTFAVAGWPVNRTTMAAWRVARGRALTKRARA